MPNFDANSAARSRLLLPAATTLKLAPRSASRINLEAMRPGPRMPQRTLSDDGISDSSYLETWLARGETRAAFTCTTSASWVAPASWAQSASSASSASSAAGISRSLWVE